MIEMSKTSIRSQPFMDALKVLEFCCSFLIISCKELPCFHFAFYFFKTVSFLLFLTRSLPLLLPAVEDGIFNDSWRIRQSSVELLGDLLFKVNGFNVFQFSFVVVWWLLLSEWVCISTRLQELLGKHCLRVVVMMRVQVPKLMGGLSLRFLEGINVMRSLLHYIWLELMSAYQCVR